MGRPPKPTALKIAQGNPGKRAINTNEPKPAGQLGNPPECLTKDAKQVWRQYAPKLVAVGIGTNVDRATFESFCRSFALWRQLRKTGEANPIVKINGQPVPNPALSLAQREHKEWSAMAIQFGLTPSARVKLATDQPGEVDELASFMAGPAPTPTPLRLVR